MSFRLVPTMSDVDLERQEKATDQDEDKVSSLDHPSGVHKLVAKLKELRSPNATKAPKDTLKAVYAAGRYKASLTLPVLATHSFMAGVYIAMAGHLFLAIGGGLLGSAFFATGLIAVVLTSGELFTGDALVFVASVLGQQVKLQSLLRNWSVSWIFNFVGCLVWAYLMGYLSEALDDQTSFVVAVAEKKAHAGLLAIFLKGVGANFMVCLAIWQATCAEDVASKIIALWFPVTGFVAMGFDHCIANQFFIPLGMMMGADVSIGRCIGAIFMATFGNAVGGGFGIGAVYWYTIDSIRSSNQHRQKIRRSLFRPTATPTTGSEATEHGAPPDEKGL